MTSMICKRCGKQTTDKNPAVTLSTKRGSTEPICLRCFGKISKEMTARIKLRVL